jgi:hypothetical protein
VTAFARRAAAALLPVVVDLGPGRPKVCSYADAVESGALVLRPFPAGALLEEDPAAEAGGGRPPVTIRSTDSTLPYALVARAITAAAARPERPLQDGPSASRPADAARVTLRGARLEALPPRTAGRVTASSGDPLVLVVPGEEGEVPGVMAVVDVSAAGCSVEASVALRPGTELSHVELARDRRVLRRARATTLDCLPWIAADGTRRFRIRLRLEALDVDGPPSPHDLVSAPGLVRRTLELASLLGCSARATGHDRRWAGAPSCALTPPSEPATLRLVRDREGEPATPGARVHVAFDLAEMRWEGEARVIADDGATLVTSWPLVLRRRARRQEARTTVARDAGITLRYRHPLTGRTVETPVLDLSTGGASIALGALGGEDEGQVAWPQMPVDDVELRWPARRVALGPAVARAVSDRAIHVAFLDPRATESTALVDLVASLRHPTLGVADGDRFSDLLGLYEDVGLLGPHMRRNLLPDRFRIGTAWRAAHTPACGLARTLTQEEDGRTVAAVSGVRLWEHTWSGQHMAARPGRRTRSPSALHASFVDHVLARSDCRHMVVFVRVGNQGAQSFFEAFLRSTGVPEAAGRARVALWSWPAADAAEAARAAASAPGRRGAGSGPARDDRALRVRPLTTAEEPLVARAAARTLGPTPAAALSYAPGELHLPDTHARFAAAGVSRSRRVFVVTRAGRPLLALVDERADAALNLTYLVSAAWLIPLAADALADAAVVREALRAVACWDPQTVTGERFVVAPDGAAEDALGAHALHREAAVDVFAYNRAGLLRWHYFVQGTYAARAARDGARDAARAAGQALRESA